VKLQQTCNKTLQNLLLELWFWYEASCMMSKRILAAMTAKEFLLQVTVGMELVSIMSFS